MPSRSESSEFRRRFRGLPLSKRAEIVYTTRLGRSVRSKALAAIATEYAQVSQRLPDSRFLQVAGLPFEGGALAVVLAGVAVVLARELSTLGQALVTVVLLVTLFALGARGRKRRIVRAARSEAANRRLVEE